MIYGWDLGNTKDQGGFGLSDTKVEIVPKVRLPHETCLDKWNKDVINQSLFLKQIFKI